MTRRKYATFANVTNAGLEAQGYTRVPYRDGVTNYVPTDVVALRNARANLSAIVLPAFPGVPADYDDYLFDSAMLQVQGGGIQVTDGARLMNNAQLRPRPTLPGAPNFERDAIYDGVLALAGFGTWGTQDGEAEYLACQSLITQVRSAAFSGFITDLDGIVDQLPAERKQLCNLSFYIELDAAPEHIRWDTYAVPPFAITSGSYNSGAATVTVGWSNLTGGQFAYPHYTVRLIYEVLDSGIWQPRGTDDVPWSTAGRPSSYTRNISVPAGATDIRVTGRWIDTLASPLNVLGDVGEPSVFLIGI